MEHSYLPPGASLPGYSAEASLAQLNDSSQIPFYAIFAPATYPESVAFWHDPPVQQHGMSAFGGLPMSTPQPAQSAVDQKKHKRTRSGCFTCRSRRVKVSLFSLYGPIELSNREWPIQCDETRPICESKWPYRINRVSGRILTTWTSQGVGKVNENVFTHCRHPRSLAVARAPDLRHRATPQTTMRAMTPVH